MADPLKQIGITDVADKFVAKVKEFNTAVDTALTTAGGNPNDPTSLIELQKAMANYNVALQTQSAVIKSIEDTAKSITQRL